MIINIGDHYFEIIENYKDAYNEEQFQTRYSEVLDRYPFIVGDIGFEQLRLRGFFEDKNKKVDMNKRFSSIKDYLLESCNFGCAYFVMRRMSAKEIVRLNSEDVDVEEVAENKEVLVHMDEQQSADVTAQVKISEEFEADRQTEDTEKEYNDKKTLKHFLK